MDATSSFQSVAAGGIRGISHPHRKDGNMRLIQAMRGLAALWVVLFHLAAGGHINALLSAMPPFLRIPIFDWGHYGVPVFFALSGFVIAHSLRNAQVTGGYLGRFMLRRSIRLDPPYWGAILICIIFAWLSAKVQHEPFRAPSVSDTAAHVAYAQALLGVPEINTVFWTLTFEIQFYIVLCTALYMVNLANRRGWASARPLMLAMLFAMALWSATGLTGWVIPGLFVHLWHAFFVGTLAYWSIADKAFRLPLAILIAAMMFPLGQNSADFAIASAITAILLFAAGVQGWLYNGLGWRPLQQLGLISYSLYLLHNPITGATSFIGRRLQGDSVAAGIAIAVETVAVAILAAAVYYIVVERVAHRLSRRVSPSRPGSPAAPPAAAASPHNQRLAERA